MGKIVAGVIVGYVVMFVAVFALFTAAWMVLGSAGAFQPGSWDVSTTWAAVSIVIGLVAAYLGGLVCVKIGGQKAATALIVLVLALGFALAIPALNAAPVAEARPEGIEMAEAMIKARTPAWLALLNPVLGALGVWMAAKGGKAPDATI